jgi:AcrR family transcriptional regulator
MELGECNYTEQTILKVAERLFLKKGYALTSTTGIAREARVGACEDFCVNV